MVLYANKPDFYSTYMNPVNYYINAVLANTPMANYLMDIANHAKLNLNIIRALLKLILTNNLDYQLALFLIRVRWYRLNYFDLYITIYIWTSRSYN